MRLLRCFPNDTVMNQSTCAELNSCLSVSPTIMVFYICILLKQSVLGVLKKSHVHPFVFSQDFPELAH